ncbi:unnamed protein product, partial [Lampetra fluviatilis]
LYACHASNVTHLLVAKAELTGVLRRPLIDASRSSFPQLSVPCGSTPSGTTTLSCCLVDHVPDVVAEWRRGDVLVQGPHAIHPDVCSRYALPTGCSDSSFSCHFTSKAGIATLTIRVSYISESDDVTCGARLEAGLQWPVTRADTVAYVSCPDQWEGSVLR